MLQAQPNPAPKVRNFSYRRPHRSSIRPRDEPVEKDAAITYGQITSVYNCMVCKYEVSGNDQRYPVQVIALLGESGLDLVGRSKAVLEPSLFVSFCRVKPLH
jgi:hypothetical protein